VTYSSAFQSWRARWRSPPGARLCPLLGRLRNLCLLASGASFARARGRHFVSPPSSLVGGKRERAEVGGQSNWIVMCAV